MKRRRFSEADVLAAVHFNHGAIRCYRCKEPLEPHQKIEREHLTEVAIGGLDLPQNCAYSHKDCHSVVTNGPPATSAGSSKNRIAKTKRIPKKMVVSKPPIDDPKPKAKKHPWVKHRALRSRGFAPGKRPMRGK